MSLMAVSNGYLHMATIRTLIRSITAGLTIGLGGIAFLSVDNKIIGAFLFSLGLLSICITGQLLYTGRVSYTNNIFYLIIVLIGNTIGASGFGIITHYMKPELVSRATSMCSNKISEGLLVIPLGILCNILIYYAVEGYKQGCWILLILCVMAFILCGFEHSIANMFYFGVAGINGFLYILMTILGNTIGGVIVYCINQYTIGEIQ